MYTSKNTTSSSKNKKETIINKHAKNIGIVMALTLLSKVFGFARDMILAYFYGATNVSDAYLVSLTIPEFVFSLVIQAIAVGFIPIFVEIMHENGRQKADHFTSQVLSILYVLGVITVVCINIAPNFFVSLFATGFDQETIRLTSQFVRITSIALFFKGTVSVLSAYCQAKGEFTRPAISGLPLDIVIIASIIISYKTHTLVLAYGTVCAYASQVLLFIPYCRNEKYIFRPCIDWNDPHIRRMVSLFIPVIVGVGANQINILIDRTLASTLAVGGISSLNYANKVDNIMENVMVASIAGVMYPTFAKLASERKNDELAASLEKTLEEVMLIIMPITIGSILFAQPIISLLFGRGAFDETATALTSSAMIGYSVGMIGVSFRAVLTRVYYSIQDVKATVINSVIAIAINIILNVVLSKFLGIGGLALASSVSSLGCAVLLLVQLKKRIGYNSKVLIAPMMKILGVSVLMGSISFGTYHVLISKMNSILALLFSIAVGIAVYTWIGLVARLPGMNEIFTILRKRMKK